MSNIINPLNIYTVEDCLEIIAGLSDILISPPIVLQQRDRNIISNIAMKTFKGTGLTDKQLAVVKKILITNYAKDFLERGIDLPKSLEQLRGPLRELDRSTFIKIKSIEDIPELKQTYNQGNFHLEHKVIMVRFPFNLSYARVINDIKKKYKYDDRYFNFDNQYLFPYEEKYVYHLVNKFKDKIKDIDPTLMSVYEKLCEINQHPEQHVPGIYNYQIRNVPQTFVDILHNKFGAPNKENLYLYKDRQQALALEHMDNLAVEQSFSNVNILTKKIAARSTFIVNINPNKWNLDQILNSLIELQRFPLLVVLNEKTAVDDYHEIHTKLRNLFNNDQMTVMFRLPNHGEKNIEFNKMVSDNGANKPVDKNTKIVYINNRRVPKPLIKSDWSAESAINLRNEREHNQVQNFLQQCDLIVQYDSEESPWNTWHHEVEKI